MSLILSDLIYYRRWVLKMIAGKGSNLLEIVAKESELVKRIAEVYFCLINFHLKLFQQLF